jgi:hypothetical protein
MSDQLLATNLKALRELTERIRIQRDAQRAAGQAPGNVGSPPTVEDYNGPSLTCQSAPVDAQDRAHVRSCASVVGQEMLREYQRLQEFQRRREAMRESIVEMIEGGAAIEPGMLSAHLRSTEQRRFSAEQLERLFGAEQVERLRMRLQPIVVVQLIVEPSTPRSRHR